jgi:alanine dehydrogenase
MIVIRDEEIRRLVRFEVVLAALERAFVALEEGASSIFDVARGRGGGPEHFFAVKSAREGSIPMLGLKAGSYAPGNHARGLDAHTSTTLLIDDATGAPLAVVEANYLNALRTSGVNALATRRLARPDAATLGIIGIGHQAIYEALAVCHVRPIERIIAVGSDAGRRAKFVEGVRTRLERWGHRANAGVDIEFADARTASSNADVLVTVTPSRAPIVQAAWVRPGTHISAMGADDVGKQELDVDLVSNALCFADHPEQSIRIGEFQHAHKAGRLSLQGLRERTLGRLIRDPDSCTRSPETITVFDSSGLAIQDIAAAHAAMLAVRLQS